MDYLALVGDAADGYPGLQGWGASLLRPFCRVGSLFIVCVEERLDSGVRDAVSY